MDGETCIRQAYEAIFQGDFERAIEFFRQAMELEPDNASYAYRASITSARSGKLGLALEYATRACELVPDELQYELNRRTLEAKQLAAFAYADLSSEPPAVDKALDFAAKAAELDPLSVEARLLLGIGFRMQGRYREAVSSFRETLSLEPNHNEALRLLRETRAEWKHLVRLQTRQSPKKRNR